MRSHLSESFALAAAVFLRFGTGILHSIEKATQFVQGTPKLAASHLTYTPSRQDRGVHKRSNTVFLTVAL